MNGISGHAWKRMIERGIGRRAVEDACSNPTRVILQANGNTAYVGLNCTVILNPDGWVVTVF